MVRCASLWQAPLLDCDHPDAPEAAEEANERGMAAFKMKQWEQALQEYTQAVLLQPEKVAYRGNRAAAALKMHRPSIAVEDGVHTSAYPRDGHPEGRRLA